MNGLRNMRKNNALFLDIDGVLNTSAARKAIQCKFHFVKTYGGDLKKTDLDIVEECMERMITLIREHDLDVVITSMWRFGAKLTWFKELFELYGLELPIERFSTITTCDCEQERDGGRLEFIEDHLLLFPYDNYVMIDDTFSHYMKEHDNLVVTDIKYGFTEKDYQKADTILKK